MRLQTLVILIAVGFSAAAMAGAGVPATPSEAHNPLDDLAEARHARALAERLMEADPAEAFRLVAAEAGHAPLAAPAVEDPVAALARAGVEPSELPPALVEPVGRLMAAIAAAETLRTEAVADLAPEERNLVLSGSLWAHDADLPAAPSDGAGHASADLVTFTERYDAEARAAIAAKVDMDKIVTGTLLLLQTVRDVLPDLPALPLDSDGPGEPVCSTAPPSIFDHPGVLAIDNANKRWTADYLLILDLGGHDCHENTAGTGTSGIELVIDITGDDTYSETSTTGGVTGIGYGAMGIGIVVDASGRDDYRLTSTRSAPQPGPVAGTASVTGQGVGALGAGVLVDLDGAARFDAQAATSGGSATVTAQGAGSLGGVGLLLSGAGGQDTASGYVASALSTLHLVSRTPSQSTYSIGPGTVVAQGAGNGGGALVDAAGDDTYTATTSGARGATQAQGSGVGGAGILVDAAGNDVYDAHAVGDVTLTLIVTDTNFCWTVTVNTSTETTETVAQGAARTGAGILVDLSSGDRDRFTAGARSAATSHAEVALSASTFCTNSAHATANTGTAQVLAQGLAQTGTGVLLGGTSADIYRLEAASSGTARALVHHGRVGGNTADARSGSADTRGHGLAQLGVGLIADLGGNDQYRHAGFTFATETTTAGGTVPGTSGLVSLVGQGWATGGVGWLVDLGGTDTYSLPPGGNDKCWTHPQSGAGNLDHGRGRDLSSPFVPPPAGCP